MSYGQFDQPILLGLKIVSLVVVKVLTNAKFRIESLVKTGDFNCNNSIESSKKAALIKIYHFKLKKKLYTHTANFHMTAFA